MNKSIPTSIPRTSWCSFASVAILLALLPATSSAQTAEDDSLITSALFASRHAVLNGRVYFSADNGIQGSELWVSDGTATGTFMVKDINPGAGDSDPDYLTAVGNRVFFAARNGSNTSLWTTDGTSAGTVQIGPVGLTPRFLAATGNVCYFAGTQSATGIEPWVSDGTTAGTRLVADVNPGSASSAPLHFTAVNGTVFFSAETTITTGTGKKKNTTPTGVELFKTNGTAAGTVLVKDIDPGSSHSLPDNLFAFNGTLYFSAHFPNAGDELMRSDGTAAGTVLVKDIVPGTMSSNPRNFRVHAGKLIFSATSGTSGWVWQTDGTAAGTVQATLLPGVAGTQGTNFAVLGSRLVVQAETGGGSQLWSTDGTTSTLLATLNPPDGFPEAFLQTIQLGDRLLFTVFSRTLGIDLYATDGTTAGTVLVKDFQPVAHPVPEPLFFGQVAGGIVLTAPDGPSGHELRVTDGTTAGTVIVKDILAD